MRTTLTQNNQTLYSAIANANTRTSLAKTLFEVAAVFGYMSATLMLMPAKTDVTAASLVLESSLDRQFFCDYDAVCPAHLCVLYNAARRSTLPIVWDADQIARQHQLMSAPEPPLLAVFRNYGVSAGMLMPLSTIDGTRHLIRFDGDRPAPMQNETNDLFMLSMHFFDAYDRLRHPAGENPLELTERELDVVRWSATGKTSAEIGLILSLSDHTINAYMNNALKKLDCVNRTQLVAKALRMRIIS